MASHYFSELTGPELATLNPDRTIVLSSLSPLEVHGPHLPIGTDIAIAEALKGRIARTIESRHPELNILFMPSLPLGSDPIPVRGSIPVRPRVIESAITDWGAALARLGFRYWILADNHGGPHHQISIEIAARRLRRRGIVLIAPFHYTFRQMIAGSPEMRRSTGLGAGEDGGLDDLHAGTNETSLMLAFFPERVREGWERIGPARRPRPALLARMLAWAAGFLDRLGARGTALDLKYLSVAFAWVSEPGMESYQGDPSRSGREAGERMLEYRAAEACRLLEEAMAGHWPALKPMGWSIRILRRIV